MDKGKYKPFSFYVPERDTELMGFIAAQSNMSLSMRLLMKAFIASNRHETDIDVGTMDLGDLIRGMRVDPELFDDVPRRVRPRRSISAIEAEEAMAAEAAARERAASMGQAPGQDLRSVPGLSGYRQQPEAYPPQGRWQAAGDAQPAGHEPPSGYGQPDGHGQPAGREAPSGYAPERDAPAPMSVPPAQRPGPAPAPVPPQGADDELDPMAMMGEGM